MGIRETMASTPKGIPFSGPALAPASAAAGHPMRRVPRIQTKAATRKTMAALKSMPNPKRRMISSPSQGPTALPTMPATPMTPIDWANRPAGARSAQRTWSR